MSQRLKHAKLNGANLTDMDLTDTKLKQAQFGNTTVSDGSIRTD